MRAHTPFVSVVVPVFDHAERLALCLSALRKQTYPRGLYEIVVVDNGAGLSPSHAAGFECTRIISEESPGSYAARNRGVSVSQGEVIAFTDADCVPAPDWIAMGVAALLKTPETGFAAGLIAVHAEDRERPTATELYESVTAFRQREYVERWSFGATANLFTFRRVFARIRFLLVPLSGKWGDFGRGKFADGSP